MSCGVISDALLVTPGLRCAPSFLAKALRPAAVKPPFGSFSRDLAERLRGDFFAVFLRATRLRPMRFFADFFVVDFLPFFADMRMLSTRLG